MPLPISARLSFTCSAGLAGPCNSTHSTTSTALASRLSSSRKLNTARQTRVLLTATAATSHRYKTNAVPRLRSPLQWSSIVHHSRAPTLTPLSASGTMGKMENSQQVRAHSHSHGHGHGHHHHHDTTFLTSANRNDPGVKITRVGLYVNLGMAVAKGAGGYIFNSQALTADALHALTDLVSDIMTLATISYSLKPATSRFPTGYGKIESLGALAVSGLLLSGGIMIGLQAIMALSQQFFPEIAHILSHLEIFGHGHGHSHSHGAEHFGPNINAAWLAGGSIIIKEWLYRATMKVASKKRSSVLASNAYHHRVDSLTAFVALLTISASHFLTNAAWLDPVGGLVISGMIVQAGWGNTKSALLELADVAMDEEVKENVEKAATQALSAHTSDAVQIRGIQGIKSGQNFLVDIEVGAPSSWTVGDLNAVEDAIREKIAADVKGVRRVTVRFASGEKEAEPFADEFVKGRADDVEGEGEHDHDHEHDHANGHSSSVQGNGTANKRK